MLAILIHTLPPPHLKEQVQVLRPKKHLGRVGYLKSEGNKKSDYCTNKGLL